MVTDGEGKRATGAPTPAFPEARERTTKWALTSEGLQPDCRHDPVDSLTEPHTYVVE